MRRLLTTAIAALLTAAFGLAQTPAPSRSPSPDGIASIQVGAWKPDDAPAARMAAGKWIDVLYGRPIKRGRRGCSARAPRMAAALKGGAAVWRAGANVLTRLRTEVPLTFGGRPCRPANTRCSST